MIVNGRLVVPNDSGCFECREGLAIRFDERIIEIVPQHLQDWQQAGEIIDAKGEYVSPGFINVHIHGCNGADAMDESPKAVEQMQSYLPRSGVTAFLPTTMTESLDNIRAALSNIERCRKMTQKAVAKVLGANVEGPYINPSYKGAQAESNIRVADFTELADFAGVISIMTVAPERLKDWSFVEDCTNAGIILSIGHSGADYETALKALANGFSHITHLFNAQTGLHHRRPGIVGAALDSDAVVELIADNVHVHPMLQRLIWKAKTHSKIVLVTDSLRAAGLGDGTFDLGGQRVIVKDGLAKLEDGTIAASVATMNEVMARFSVNVGATVAQTVELVTKNPAQELGIYDRLGSLEVGKDADLVIFDEGYNVSHAFVNGRSYEA